MKRLPALLLVPIFLLFITCGKQNPLPQNTETGQNTFGCLINGKAYVPDGGGGWSGLKPVNGGFLGIYYTPLGLDRGVFIRTYAKNKQRFELYLNDYTLGRHPLKYTTGTKPALIYPKDYGKYQSEAGDEYVTSTTHTGWINITKADTSNGIVAGTFEFRAASPAGKIVNVTQGRFDVNVSTQ